MPKNQNCEQNSTLLALLVFMVGPLFAPYDGCTPGFWKNHLDYWPTLTDSNGILIEISPSQPVSEFFAAAIGYADLGNLTLLQALKLGGGKGELGAAKILLRHSVAALLNVAHPRVHWYGIRYVRDSEGNYGTYLDLIDLVNAALESHNRKALLSLAADLDEWNNWNCPLLAGWNNPK